VLAAVVLTAVLGLLDFRTLLRMRHVSRIDFYAAMTALAAVLLLGILQGILLAALVSILLLVVRASRPHVAFLGRVPGRNLFSDLARHPENEGLVGVLAFRPETSLLYINCDSVLETVLTRLRAATPAPVRLVVCDLSASPVIDLAGSRMLHELHAELARRGVMLRIIGAHGSVRDLLRADGVGDKVGGVEREITLLQLLENGGEPQTHEVSGVRPPQDQPKSDRPS
jgi:MFS superfamily sulfate permease-like transporter